MPRNFRTSIDKKLATIAPIHARQVTAYLDERGVNGVKDTTLLLDLGYIQAWSQSLGLKKFEEATREDVKLFVNGRGTSGSRLGTARLKLRKITLKSFQRWVRGGGRRDPYPPEVAWLEIHKERDADRVLTEVLSREELGRLIDAQTNAQDRAIVAVLYDSGMRAGELCSLRLRDVLVDEFGAILRLPKGVEGLKTGARHVRIIHSVPYLLRWINDYPRKNDPNAPLWVSRSPRSWLKPLSTKGLHEKIVRMGKTAGLQRELWPHLFRHSRATEAVKEGMPESEMRIFFGWTKNSDMPSRYIHLAGTDVDEGILRRAGKLTDRPRIGPLESRACPVCKTANVLTDAYCTKCKSALLPGAADQRAADILVEALNRNPELLRAALKEMAKKENEEDRTARG